MKRPCRRRTQTPHRQLDFLDLNPPSARSAGPDWDTLPQQTRLALTGLVTRLLVEHAGGEMRDPRSCADEQ